MTYTESNNKRTFSSEVSEEKLVWHRDRTDRTVTILEGKNWKLQMDNELPKELIPGSKYFIPKYTFHRIIKGMGNLIIEIENHA